MNLTEHFLERELGVQSEISEIQDIARWGCRNILEPIHAKFGPLVVTSAYRDADHNKLVGGVAEKSFHLYPTSPSAKGAADVYPPAADHSHSAERVLELFDWLRLESNLPFDKVILEYSGAIAEVVHIQWYVIPVGSKFGPRPKSAWIGATHGATGYRSAQCSEAIVWPDAAQGASA